MATLLTEFREPIRAILGDFNSTVRRYGDSAIDSVVKTLVNSGRFPGYTMNVAGLSIDPTVAVGVDYARIVYLAALTFVGPNAGSYAYKTRALSESFGHQTVFLNELHDALHEIDTGGGAMFTSTLSFRSWVLSLTGMGAYGELVDVEVEAPVATVTVGQDGVQVET